MSKIKPELLSSILQVLLGVTWIVYSENGALFLLNILGIYNHREWLQF